MNRQGLGEVCASGENLFDAAMPRDGNDLKAEKLQGVNEVVIKVQLTKLLLLSDQKQNGFSVQEPKSSSSRGDAEDPLGVKRDWIPQSWKC